MFDIIWKNASICNMNTNFSLYFKLNRQIPVRELALIVICIMAGLFFLACSFLICRCCCRGSKSQRYRDKNSALLHRSSFHSQQRLNPRNCQSPSVNGSMPRNANSRVSLRAAGQNSSHQRVIPSK